LRQFPVAAVALVLCAAAVVWRRIEVFRGNRLASELNSLLRLPQPVTEVFNELSSLLAHSCQLRWAGLVSWSAADLSGRVALAWGHPSKAPPETSLGSWLLRETEAAAELLFADTTVGSKVTRVAMPMSQDGRVTGYLVLVLSRSLPRKVDAALRRCHPDLVKVFGRPDERAAQRLAAVS
jgi:hypothetical protein